MSNRKTDTQPQAGQLAAFPPALGSAAWLRAQADEREEMLHALGALDEEGERETKREILGLRDAAARMDLLDAAAIACHAAMLGKVNPKSPAWGVLFAAQDFHRRNVPVSNSAGS